MQLSADQQAAASAFIAFLLDDTKHEILLTGNAGTGKSFLTKYLVKLARNNTSLLSLIGSIDNDLNIEFTASTNKAAVILQEKVGEKAGTIHSLLGLKVTNNFSTGRTSLQKTTNTKVLSNTLVIIDEASMIDKKLLEIIRQQTFNCKILFIGDSAQLAPVLEIDSPVFSSVTNVLKLTTVQRQHEKNPIIQLSQQLRDIVETGNFTDILDNGVQIKHLNGVDFKSEIGKRFTTNYTVDSCKILAWTNKKIHQYNEHVHQLITGTSEISVGDVMVTNNPILDSGLRTAHATDSFIVVRSVEPGESRGLKGNWVTIKDSRIKVFVADSFNDVSHKLKAFAKVKDWPTYFEYKDFFKDLRNIYASTVHKSQGSTYGTVFIDLTDIGSNHKAEEVARLLYVAATRAAEEIIFYGKLPDKYRSGSTTFSI